MVKKVVYTNNGKVVVNSIDTRNLDQVYIDRMVSQGFTDAVVIDASTFPENNKYSDAWELSGNSITVNMSLAKNIKRDTLRRERESQFQIMDKLYIEAQSSKKGLEDIKTRQQYLRDITENPAIEAATTVDELDTITIDSWTIPAIKEKADEVIIHVKENEPESSTTSKDYKRKSRLTFESESAKYLITFSAEVKNTNKNGNCKVIILLDDEEINRTNRKADPFELDYSIVSGSIIKTLTEGTHNLDLKYATSKGVCYIRRVRLQAMKIEN